MIDERINRTLSELESNLRDVESATEQVERIVNSYDELKSTTAEYVSTLGEITTNVKELVDSLGNDYDQKVRSFEEERESILASITAASKNLSDATDTFNKSLISIQQRIKYELIITSISLIAIGVLLFFSMK